MDKQRLQMATHLMYLKQLNCIYIYVYLWLAYLAVINAEEMLQQNPHEIGPLKHQTVGAPRGIPELVEVAALGRPLFPGMLYDCRRDSFIPGVTLWDKKSLSEDLDSRPKPLTDLKFSSSDSLSIKFNLLDVSASLKASFLGGLVEVGGSAKFLRDTKSSHRQSRVTMYYSETTRYEQLTMSQLGRFTYPQVFDQKSATHVVVAVLYGAQAFMVFDRTLSEEENKQEIEGELDAMVKKIPAFSIEANAALKMTDAEKKMAEKITCTFHGDVRLEQNPTTYVEALSLYKTLPTLLKDPQNQVPVKVWLYPLHLLNSKAAQVEREISTRVAFETEAIIEELGETEMTYNELSGNTLVNSFKDIKERLRSFQSSFSIYKAMLLKAVNRVLPAIRGGEMEEKSLEDILKIHRSSPFNAEMLNQWLNDAKSELDLLSSVTKQLEGFTFEDSDHLNSIIINPQLSAVLCLTLTSLKYEDPYLSALNEFLKTDRFKEPYGEQNMVSVASVGKWFNDSDIIAKLSENIRIIRDSYISTQSLSHKFPYNIPVLPHNFLYIISAISDSSNPGSSIYLYVNGKLTNRRAQHMSLSYPELFKHIILKVN
ncbi:stonustoxin subunit alpha-like [Chanodichthys erythropterus]|uniref:stonustoxin subunit alpha-like n=1 Tax=Chanodichthys erythropterus TaxID=933992 RepID=UPI00351E778A